MKACSRITRISSTRLPPPSLLPGADRADAPLPVGQSFTDTAAGVTFTTLAAGGSEPDQWIDVKIKFEPRIEITASSVLVDEASGHAEIRLKRSFGTESQCSVSYATQDGTALSGNDYHATTGTVTWRAGDTSDKSILIPIRPDDLPEGPETLNVTLFSPQNAILVPKAASAQITILDAGSRFPDFDPPFFNNTVDTVVPLENGKVLIGGNIVAGDITGNIARLNPDGSEDTTFLKGSGFNARVRTIRPRKGGKILVGGDFTSYDGSPVARLARLNADGLLDAGFTANTGSGANSSVLSLAIETDGSILAGGNFTSFNNSPKSALIRLKPSGAPDTAKPLTTPFNTQILPRVDSITPQKDGKIMIAGNFIFTFQFGTGFRSGIARLNPDGSRDPSFEPGHGAHDQGNTSFIRSVSAVSRQSDGDYVIAGNFTAYNGTPASRIARLSPSGAINPSFPAPGLDFNDSVEALLPLPDGKFLAAGRFTSPDGGVVRMTPAGEIDPSFDTSGGAGGPVFSALSDTDGNLFLGGNFFSFAGTPSRPVVKVAAATDRYALWKTRVFSASQIGAGLTGPEEDFDADGILNLTEMALGTSPTVRDSPATFTVAAENLSLQTASDTARLEATMLRSARNLGVWLVAEFSDDLVNWNPSVPSPGSNSAYDVVESTATRFTVRDKTPSSEKTKRFVRFRAILPN